MPRAATAIIAIACSASGYLSRDAGILPVGCDPKAKRSRALSRQTLAKQNLVFSELDTSSEQDEATDEATLAHLSSWSSVCTDIELLSPMSSPVSRKSIDIQALGKVSLEEIEALRKVCKTLGAAVPGLGTLPEDFLLSTLEYTGTQGRAVCRAAKQGCDANLLLPTFPVSLSVKQHYHFGPHRPVTTTWSLDVVSPSAPGMLKVCTDCGSEEQENDEAHQSVQSGTQTLRLCHELRSLQTTFGATYKEDGRAQVEVLAIDAAGRTLVDHSYEHHIFQSKADDLLELLTAETEVPAPSTPSMRTNCPQGVASTCAGTRPAARTRPASRLA